MGTAVPLEQTFGAYADQYADQYGIPREIFRALVTQESGWNPTARGTSGEVGLTQLMPGTAKDLGVDTANPYANLEGGARYLSQQFKAFGSWAQALVAYNAGPGNLGKVLSGAGDANNAAAVAKGTQYSDAVLSAAKARGFTGSDATNVSTDTFPKTGLTFDLSDFGIPKYDLSDPFNWAMDMAKGATKTAENTVVDGVAGVGTAIDTAGGIYSALTSADFWRTAGWYIVAAIAGLFLLFFGTSALFRSDAK